MSAVSQYATVRVVYHDGIQDTWQNVSHVTREPQRIILTAEEMYRNKQFAANIGLNVSRTEYATKKKALSQSVCDMTISVTITDNISNSFSVTTVAR